MTLVEMIRGQRDIRRVDADRIGAVRSARQDTGRGRGLPRLHRQSDSDADDQRGDLRRDGRRRYAGGDRHRDEARHESSDGTADARRLHRPRRLPGDSRGPARRAWAIRSTAPARYCGGWSRRASSDGNPARAFTRTSQSTRAIGPQHDQFAWPADFALSRSRRAEDLVAFGPRKDVPPGDKPSVAERPQQLDPRTERTAGRRAIQSSSRCVAHAAAHISATRATGRRVRAAARTPRPDATAGDCDTRLWVIERWDPSNEQDRDQARRPAPRT